MNHRIRKMRNWSVHHASIEESSNLRAAPLPPMPTVTERVHVGLLHEASPQRRGTVARPPFGTWIFLKACKHTRQSLTVNKKSNRMDICSRVSECYTLLTEPPRTVKSLDTCSPCDQTPKQLHDKLVPLPHIGSTCMPSTHSGSNVTSR